MTNYRLLIRYDGTRYNGWQRLGDTDNTIQTKLETTLERLTGEKAEIIGAGRTDAGVHAMEQVAHVRLEKHFEPEEIRSYLNRYLPDDIGILSVTYAPPRFHARYSAVQKTYRYRIGKNKAAHVFERRYVYEYDGTLDVNAMKMATIQLRGEHDFKSFCGNPRMRKSTVRTIHTIRIEETEDEIDLTFVGNGFLQHMVRILVGTLIEVGEGRRDPTSMDALLEARDRRMAGPTAPAKGLTMIKVDYD